MLTSQLLSSIEATFPASTAMDGDRIGMQIDSGSGKINKCLVSLDVTAESVAEAMSIGCDSIISFHPLLFNPLSTITQDRRVERLVHTLIKAGVTVISIHTNFDAHPHGTNFHFASRVGLNISGPLVPATQLESFGMGLICEASGVSFEELLQRVRHVCGSPIRYCTGRSQIVQRVAIVCGSGMSLFEAAKNCGADVFITADVKYHNFLDAEGSIAIIDPGHFEMEQFVPEALVAILEDVTRDHGDAPTFVCAATRTNPLRYLN